MSTWTDVALAVIFSLNAFAVGYLNGRIDERHRKRASP